MASTDLSKLTKRTLSVPRGFEYTYYTSPARPGMPTVLLLHGFPDSATLWADVINNHLLPSGYGIISPDLLGYGGTSKPTDPSCYALDLMSTDLISVLDAESATTVISLGHDWGCGLAQRLYLHHPTRVSGLVTMNVPYNPPNGQPWDIDNIIAMTTAAFGYGAYHYWALFTGPDGAQILNANPDSFYDVAHGAPESFLQTFCHPDGVRDFVVQGRRQSVQAYAQGAHREEWLARMKRDGFDAPLCWYKAMVSGFSVEGETQIKDEVKVVNVPTLFWGGKRDLVCRPEMMQPVVDGGYLPKLTTKLVDEGHWGFLAVPEVFGADLLEWLGDHF